MSFLFRWMRAHFVCVCAEKLKIQIAEIQIAEIQIAEIQIAEIRIAEKNINGQAQGARRSQRAIHQT